KTLYGKGKFGTTPREWYVYQNFSHFFVAFCSSFLNKLFWVCANKYEIYMYVCVCVCVYLENENYTSELERDECLVQLANIKEDIQDVNRNIDKMNVSSFICI